MRDGTRVVQPSFWPNEEFAGMSSTAEFFLGAKGRRLPDSAVGRRPPIFSANIFDSEGKKIWFGDIETENAGKALLTLSEKLGPLYLIDETDGRFLSKRPSPHFLRHIAMVIIEDGRILYSVDLAERLEIIKKKRIELGPIVAVFKKAIINYCQEVVNE
jgi:hypothetical protein